MDNTAIGVKEVALKYTFGAFCCFATICLTVYCVYQYILDEDVARIGFKEFNSENDHIYPAVTMCFPRPLVEQKFKKYGDGINANTYSSFLRGIHWDNRMTHINYDDVSINFEDYLLGKIYYIQYMQYISLNVISSITKT